MERCWRGSRVPPSSRRPAGEIFLPSREPVKYTNAIGWSCHHHFIAAGGNILIGKWDLGRREMWLYCKAPANPSSYITTSRKILFSSPMIALQSSR